MSTDQPEEFTVTVNRDDFLADLRIAATAAEEKGTIPVFSAVLIAVSPGAMILTCDDASRRTTVAHGGPRESRGSGSAAVAAHALIRIVETLGQRVTLESASPADLALSSGRMLVKMHGWTASDLPSAVVVDPVTAVRLSASKLSAACRGILHCISREESRFQLCGAQVSAADGRLWCVATDGHRLGVSSFETDAEFSPILLPRETIADLAGLIDNPVSPDIELQIGATHATLSDGRVARTARILEGKFPQWQAIKTKEWATEATLYSAEVEGACAALKAIGAVRGATKLQFSDGKLIATARNDFGEPISAEIDLGAKSVTGSDLTVGISRKYFNRAAATRPGLLEMRLKDAESIILLCSPGELEANYELIMPMRMQ